MVLKKKNYKRSPLPIVIPAHFKSRIRRISSANVIMVNKCLREASGALVVRPNESVSKFRSKSCGDLRVIYKISGGKIYPLTVFKKKKK